MSFRCPSLPSVSTLRTCDLANGPFAKQMKICCARDPHYPASYITDGNDSGTFPDDTKDMVHARPAKRSDYEFNCLSRVSASVR